MRRALAMAGMLMLFAAAPLLGIATALAGDADRSVAMRTPIPAPPKPQGDHCVADTALMRRYHMQMLLHQRQETVHEGIRSGQFGLTQCISCHAVKGQDGAPVAYSDPKHFCRSCHDYAAVSIDCFDCHASRPKPTKQTAQAVPAGHLAADLETYLREVGR